MFWSTAAYFAIYYACHPLIGNNALWLAFTLYMFLRGVIQYFMTRRLKCILAKASVCHRRPKPHTPTAHGSNRRVRTSYILIPKQVA